MSSTKLYTEDDITRYIDITVEKITDEFKTQFEIFDGIRAKVSLIPQLQADIATLKTDMHTVKTTIKATNDDIRHLGW